MAMAYEYPECPRCNEHHGPGEYLKCAERLWELLEAEREQSHAPETATERDRLKALVAELVEVCETAADEVSKDRYAAFPTNDSSGRWMVVGKLRAAIAKAKNT